MVSFIYRVLSCVPLVLLGILGFCALALGGAYTAQYGFSLAPCPLCEWQRVPFWAAGAVALLGLMIGRRYGAWCIVVCAGLFAANAALAFHHTGVEQHWWASILESCAVPQDLAQALETLAPAVPCDVIPWADPLFGLSMAVYNTIACTCAAVGCTLSFWIIRVSLPQSAQA